MKSIVWSEAARRHLRDIHAYICKDSSRYADNVVASIKRAMTRLGRFPLSGAIVADANRDGVREIRSGVYRVIYIVRSEVTILAVLHGARDVSNGDA